MEKKFKISQIEIYIINEIIIDFIDYLKNFLKDDEPIENKMMKKHTTFRRPIKIFC